jgi:hypothetical protein
MTRPLNDLTAGGPERLTERMVGGEDEVQAVTRARGGDTEAFRFLVERHSRGVFRLAFRMTGNEHDAEDVVQETFLKAYRKLSAFEERAQFGSWVHRIAAWSARRVRTATARWPCPRTTPPRSGSWREAKCAAACVRPWRV